MIIEVGADDASERLKNMGKQVESADKAIQRAVRGSSVAAFQQLGDVAVDAALGAEIAWDQMIKSLIAGIAKAIIQMAILNAIAGAASGGAVPAAIAVANTRDYSGPGPANVDYSGPGYSKGGIVRAQAFASGGITKQDRAGIDLMAAGSGASKVIEITQASRGAVLAQGGALIPGVDLGVDEVPVIARPKEAVLPPKLTGLLIHAAEQPREAEATKRAMQTTTMNTGLGPLKPGTSTQSSEEPPEITLKVEVPKGSIVDLRSLLESDPVAVGRAVARAYRRRTV
jgi:hypothetical protein